MIDGMNFRLHKFLYELRFRRIGPKLFQRVRGALGTLLALKSFYLLQAGYDIPAVFLFGLSLFILF